MDQAEPGAEQLSGAVEGVRGEVLDRARQEIEVPDFSSADVALSTPTFVRARNDLEWRNLIGDWDAVPTVSREFRRTERMLIRFDVYARRAVVPRVEAWLLNRLGGRMYPLVVQATENGRPYQVDLALVGLAPGEYVVELKASAAEFESTKLVAFRLRS